MIKSAITNFYFRLSLIDASQVEFVGSEIFTRFVCGFHLLSSFVKERTIKVRYENIQRYESVNISKIKKIISVKFKTKMYDKIFKI